MKTKEIIFSFFLFFLSPLMVKANTNANIIFEGKELLQINETSSIDVLVKDIVGSQLTIAGGMISIEDSTCLSIIDMTSIDNTVTVNPENGKFSLMNIGGLDHNSSLVRITLKAHEKSCKTNIKINSPKLAFYDKTQLSPDTINKELVVINYDEVTLNESNLELSVGENFQLKMYVPSGMIIAPEKVNWTSDNPTLVSVDNQGKITANKVGETNISATYGIKTLQTNVTVLDYLKGDVNGDGKINPLDHYLALRMSLGLNKPNSGELIRGDINNNNRIDAGDVYYILRRSLGLKN